MGKGRSYSDIKSQFIQSKMNDGYSNQAANKVWCKSEEKAEFENNRYSGNANQNESDFNSDLNGNGTNWHTSDDL